MTDDRPARGRIEGDTEIIEPGFRHQDSNGKKQTAESRRPERIDEPTVTDEESTLIQHDLSTDPGSRIRASLVPTQLFWAALLFVATWLTYRTTTDILKALDESLWTGAILLIVSLLLVAALIRTIQRETRARRSLNEITNRKRVVADAVREGNLTRVKEALSPVLSQLERQDEKLIREFREAGEKRTAADDYCRLFDSVVLARIDERAKALIMRESVGSAVAVTLVPHPALDAATVMWRGLTLTRAIAQLYGIEATSLSSYYLLKLIMENAALSALAEQAGDLLIQETGNSLLAKLLKPLAEFGTAGWRTYRLGQQAQKFCRPLDDP